MKIFIFFTLVLSVFSVEPVMVNPVGFVPVAYIPVYTGGFIPMMPMQQMQAPAISNRDYTAPIIPPTQNYPTQQQYQQHNYSQPNYSQNQVNPFQPFHTQDLVGQNLTPYADRLLEIDRRLAELQAEKKGSSAPTVNTKVRFRNTVLVGALANELLNKDKDSKDTARKILGGALILQKPLGSVYDKTVGRVSRATVEPLLGNTVGQIFK